MFLILSENDLNHFEELNSLKKEVQELKKNLNFYKKRTFSKPIYKTFDNSTIKNTFYSRPTSFYLKKNDLIFQVGKPSQIFSENSRASPKLMVPKPISARPYLERYSNFVGSGFIQYQEKSKKVPTKSDK